MMSQWQIPAIVLTIVTWLTAPSPSLGDMARREALRREMTPKSTQSLVGADLPPGMEPPVSVPVSTTPPDEAAAAAAGAAGAAGQAASHDEKWWRDQMSQARQTLDRDRTLAEAMQGRINSLTTDFVNRDDPAQRAVVESTRVKALAELDRLQKQIVADEKAIGDLQLDARRQGVPPGWIR